MNNSMIYYALSGAMMQSLVQGVIIFLLCRLILFTNKGLSSAWRFQLLYCSYALMFLGFIISFSHFYSPVAVPEMYKDFPFATRGSATGHFSFKNLISPYSGILAAFYLTGLMVQLLILSSGLIRIRNYRRKGKLQENNLWECRLNHLCRKLELSKNITLYFADDVLVPFTAGFLKPIILFPVAMVNRLSTQQVEAILLHELAHIKRHDYLLNIIQRIMGMILFFNPAAWLLEKALEKEREFCCDDLVLKYATDPRDYARALLLIEESKPATKNLAMAATGHQKFSLLNRIKRLSTMKKLSNHPKHKILAILSIAAIGCSLAWTIPTDSTKAKLHKQLKNVSGFLDSTPPKAPAPPKVPSIVAPAAPATPHIPAVDAPAAPTVPAAPDFDLPAPPPPPAADTTELKKYFNSAEWKQKMEAIQKHAEELQKQFNSPEWKEKMAAIEKNGKELEKKFNSPEWKNHIAAIEKNAQEIEKKFNSPEWKGKMEAIQKHSEELEKKFNSPEWKSKMEAIEKHAEEMEKKFNSPEFKKQLKEIEKIEKEEGNE